MDPNAFSANLFKWDSRSALPPSNRTVEPPVTGGLEELFQAYGVRYYTAAKLGELGFTVNTLLDMTDEELDEMMDSLCHIFRWDLLVGERYGVKAAVRAERRRLDAFSQQEPASGGAWDMVAASSGKPRKSNSKRRPATANSMEEEDDEGTEDDGGGERQREHPFIVTEPGEVARGKKNGLDYLFHLYEVCHELLIQVQNNARERGEKCPTKVTNQVFRYAHSVGATYINKPKMRHYVHCYALHCLDEASSNELRRGFKERRENVGAWRQGCYMPLVAIASRHGWDMDAVFNSHPRLSIWYVPTKLRQLCHAERSNAAAASSSVSGSGDHLPF